MNPTITLRQLLHHSSGLPDYGGLPGYHEAVRRGDPPWSEREYLERTRTHELRFEPDAGWAYSNIGYMVVRRLLETVRGQSYGEVLGTEIFAPLALERTFVPTDADLPRITFGPSAYLGDGGAPKDVPTSYRLGWVAPGVVASTAAEVARFYHALFAGELLSAPLLEAMKSVRLFDPIAGRPFARPGYGLGLQVDAEAPGGPVWGHSGGGPGSSSSACHQVRGDQRATVVVLSDGEDGPQVEETAIAGLEALAWLDAEPRPRNLGGFPSHPSTRTPMTSPNPLSLPDGWNHVAEGYTAELLPVFELYSADALELAGLPVGARVLDVAAGPGTLSLLAARRGARVTAIDFSEAMVGILGRRVAEEGLTSVEVRQGDGQSLPFDDGSFDAAFSMFGLMFFPDRAAGFRELRRVLAPGGRAVVSSWAPTDGVPLLSAMFGAIRELLPGLPFGGGKAPLSEVADFREEMESAGLDRVEIRSVEHRVEIPSIREFWATQTRSSAPVALLKRRLEPAEWDDLARDLVTRLEREFGRGPLELAWPALLGTGVR